MENKNNNRNRVIPQMFDVRPVNADGDLDMRKIESIQRTLRLEPKKKYASGRIASPVRQFQDISPNEPLRRTFPAVADKRQASNFHSIKFAAPAKRQAQEIAIRSEFPKKFPVYHEEEVYRIDPVSVSREASFVTTLKRDNLEERDVSWSEDGNVKSLELEFGQELDTDKKDVFFQEPEKIEEEKYRRKISLAEMFGSNGYRKFAFSFLGLASMMLFIIAGIGFFNRGLKIKDAALSNGKDAYVNLAMAKEGIMSRDFQKSSFEFEKAAEEFEKISKDINSMGGILVEASRFVPYFSKISSGDHMAQAGHDLSRVGVLIGETIKSLNGIKNPLSEGGESISLLKIFQNTNKNLGEILLLVESAEEHLSKVNVEDLPEDKRVQFVTLRNKLSEIKNFIAGFVHNSQIFTEVLGGNGPRKYLFLFQNNQEMRATGGFIGTYGVMDIFDGRIRKFFIDGIFNPDGQLREKVIPPAPIQKISAAWSLHDSNWFPDFPKSAEKASWFYEKTGGPTVDGVITMTPLVMQELLAITGPIEMSEYGVTVDKENFVETIQQEVEVDYDKELNQPKKILADLAPKIMDKIFNARNFSDMAKTANVLVKSLNEKQILIYSKNYEIEKILAKEGWSGEILDTQKDYVSVINTNINGFKTDGVIDETIEHRAEIGADGTVVDTVTVTRHHNGGNMEKDWWNKVNANYMRVYVPKGSILLSAEGHTREFNSPPLDYKALGFKIDAQVQMEEDSTRIDEESGTRVYEDSGKTVFANWAYVSPQETVIVKYKYQLPFKLEMNATDRPADTYSLLAQKQSGSPGSKFKSEVVYADGYDMIWSYPQEISKNGNMLRMETDLKTDKFLGAAFMKK